MYILWLLFFWHIGRRRHEVPYGQGHQPRVQVITNMKMKMISSPHSLCGAVLSWPLLFRLFFCYFALFSRYKESGWLMNHTELWCFLFVCLFVLPGSSQGSQLFTKIAGMQMPSSEFESLYHWYHYYHDALLDLGFCSPRLDTSSWVGAPVSWEMSLGDKHRNRTLPLQLGHFSWLSFITTGLRPPANHPLKEARTFANFHKTSIRHQFHFPPLVMFFIGMFVY